MSTQVADRYAPGAVLLPTLSNTPANTRATIVAYFVDFLKKQPEGEFEMNAGQSPNIKLLGPGVASLSGTAKFTLKAQNNDVVRVRKTFIFQKFNGDWLITEHHSSLMPQADN